MQDSKYFVKFINHSQISFKMSKNSEKWPCQVLKSQIWHLQISCFVWPTVKNCPSTISLSLSLYIYIHYLYFLQHLATSVAPSLLHLVFSSDRPFRRVTCLKCYQSMTTWREAGRWLLCVSPPTNHISQIEKCGLRMGALARAHEHHAWWTLRGPSTHSCLLYYCWSS